MNFRVFLLIGTVLSMFSCTKSIDQEFTKPDANLSKANPANRVKEEAGSFIEISSVDIGDLGAAEISTYDSKTQRLFVVNNSTVNKIDVLDFSNPSMPMVIGSISMNPFGGAVNSLDAHDGFLAAAIESTVKTDPGKVVVFQTDTYAPVKMIPVGSLPDMITYSPDGKFIITANEGEPNTSYNIDPLGTVSVISVKDDYAVRTLDFSLFSGMQATLQAKGLRVFGPGASFAQDMEPEYITVSKDSRTAWVTLQENNAIAKIDLRTQSITDLFPLGFKNYNTTTTAIDPSDRDGGIFFNPWPVYGIYQPDAIGVVEDHKGTPYLFSANEGDAREYEGFVEGARVGSLLLDASAFPTAQDMKTVAKLGRLNVTKTLGDVGSDGDYEALYSFGARSFSVWNGNTGSLLWDSGNDLEKRAVSVGAYDDSRSDDKGVEPEGLTLGEVDKRTLAFVGMERADAVAVYDVTNPLQPIFLQVLKTGDGPEGILFISQKDSPTKRSLLVVSSENDGVIKIYMPVSL